MDPTTEQFLEIEAIFHEALATPEETRAQLIRTRCRENDEMVAEVYSLLQACRAEEQDRAPHPAAADGRQSPVQPRRIGAYAVDRLLGRGGMGAVYLAHRADGHFEQKVAIKLIDLPLATETFRERFRQERQILAGLHHPYIARLLDGGVTAEGELYLAMEYVDGAPIHRFCRERQLSIAQRLAVFLRVCEAVQFAHRSFVVHRDLKPDNILVAEDHTPRLLDFGTAKLLSPPVPHPELTREGFLPFTPQYASPEQVLGKPITTASDTYSLGVLLYLLLTGKPPYELKELSTEEMVRVICEEAVARPGAAAGSQKRLDSDLEAILLKALRKEPEERYQTAEQLAGDLRAYREGRPVDARRGTWRYRSGKFIRRHRYGLAAALVLALSLAAGVAGVVWQARRANRERRMAEARSADLRQLSNSLLTELDEAIKELPGSTGAQKLLVTRVLEHLDRMARDAQKDRDTQVDLANAYMQLGEIQGDPYVQNLGDSSAALVSLDKAIAIAAPLAASRPHDGEALYALATAQQYRSDVLFGVGRTREAVAAMRESTQSWDRISAAPGVALNVLCDAGSAWGTLGDELGQGGTASLMDPAGAIAAYRKALALDAVILRRDPGFVRARRGISIYRMKIGSVEMETNPAGALLEFQAALQIADALPGKERDSLSMMRLQGILLRKQATALHQVGAYEQAAPLFEQALRLNQNLAAQDPSDGRALFDVATVLDDEAQSYEDAADPLLAANPRQQRENLTLAQERLQQAIAILERLLKWDPGNDLWTAYRASVRVRLGRIAARLHVNGDAGQLSAKALAELRRLAVKDEAAPLLLDQAATAFVTAEPAALRDPRFAVLCAERENAIGQGPTPAAWWTLARAYRAAGRIANARAAANRGLALLPAPQPGSVKPRLRKLLEFEAGQSTRP
jgi:tetratricopeptide (TPR) repeat protein